MNICSLELGDYRRYKLIRFPGGELHVRLEESAMREIELAESVVLTAKIRSSETLIETILLCDAIKQGTTRSVRLIVPYLPYGRADRRFSSSDCFGIATFARIIQTSDAHIVTLDAHSLNGISNFDSITDLPSDPFIQKAFQDFGNGDNSNITVLFPDKGAQTRYATVSSKYKNVLHCEKKRDLLTGKLCGFSVPEKAMFLTKKVLVVDDICDGGGTFNGIADGLKEYGLDLALYVTHGIFSKGFTELTNRFGHIYTTDSFKNIAEYEKDFSTKLTVYETRDFFLQHLPEYQTT